ncbi:MAG: VCBS repeat-containing protein, partial [Bacteroidetes bacterium]|nr:VCBS repeat-containing protein [Bacteroidota bacterium]
MSSSPISVPQGGGAVSGLGEKFSPDLFTGTGNFSVPIALPAGRNGFHPELTLAYSTGSGNGPFGLGWSLSVPGVTRKTSKGIPVYDIKKDTFILSGAEDLVLIGIEDIQQMPDSIANEQGQVYLYRPRTEGLFAKIFQYITDKRRCWKVMSKNGLVSWYGSKASFIQDVSVVSDPENPNNIFGWRLTRTEDTFGNHILYDYAHDEINQDAYHHWDQNYLTQIRYADYSASTGQSAYMVRVEFVYEDRPDPFSDHKAGFETRTVKRCNKINIYTNPENGEILTKSYLFKYSDTELAVDARPFNGVSLLCKVEVIGYDSTNNTTESLPPLSFSYSNFAPRQQKFQRLKGAQMPLTSLANNGFELIDLFGSGLQDIVQIQGQVRYWRNLGYGNFDIPRLMKEAPVGFNIGDPNVQLIDANGDGRTDIMVNSTNVSGYFSNKYGASWDTKAFRKYKQAPSFDLADPEVKMLDLNGDGITDALRNGASFQCFFNDKNEGWTGVRSISKSQISKFPNVSFSDPRVKLADMTGDGLQDIVMIYSGSITYWPNKGYGNFGAPVIMKNSPSYDYPFDPTRVFLGDIDGDGNADLIYIGVNRVTFWINQSGNSWSEPFEIAGTPTVTNLSGIRIADIMGSGVSGVLYTFDASGASENRWFFLDLTGGIKPYLLHQMDNSMGAVTRVGYLPSTNYYLADQYGMSPFDANSERKFDKRNPWNTYLPFPVQVVSRVEVIDEISLGKLTTEYVYHHGYYDGGEREFRGFGRVDQRDTETFERFNDNGLHGEQNFNQVQFEHYSPPIETRNWFHLGPVGDEFSDWSEIDFSNEYWQEDPNILQRDQATKDLLTSLPLRAKRDLFRVWRGSSLRSEMYALDQQDPITMEYIAGTDQRPYTVSESVYGARLEADPDGLSSLHVLLIPKDTSGYIFFSQALSSRTTQWERGYDPMTQFSFTTDFDNYGQPKLQFSAALPRGIMPPYTAGVSTHQPDEGGGPILCTAAATTYARKDAVDSFNNTYIVDRTCRTISYEVKQQAGENVFDMRDRVFAATLPVNVGNLLYPLIGFSVTYYDDLTPFGDGLPLGHLDKHGVPARSLQLVLTDDNVHDAYDTVPPFFSSGSPVFDTTDYPPDFVNSLQNSDNRLGYKRKEHSSDSNLATGWYSESGRTRYDWQPTGIGRGLPQETKDVFDAWSSIEYDQYDLLPVTARQYLTSYNDHILAPQNDVYLATTAVYDYRVMQAHIVTDPNSNRTVFGFSPLGLLMQSGIIGKIGNNEGDIVSESPFSYKPSVRMEYDFFAYKCHAKPVWVKTIHSEQHYQQGAGNPVQLDSPTITKVEYSDGFGRLLQTRAQAEDVIFGDSKFGDSGLPADQSAANQPAVGVQRNLLGELNVVVSGWQVYNNKGKVVEKYEPFFDTGFDYTPPFDLALLALGLGGDMGEKIRMYYDPRGNVIRTVNPDDSEQWVIHGRPDNLDSVKVDNHWSFSGYTPT